MGAELYRFTLEEYKEMKRELRELDSLLGVLRNMKREDEYGTMTAAYREACGEVLKQRNYVNVLTDGWRGEDAASFKDTIDELRNEIGNAFNEYMSGVNIALTNANARYNELERMIRECEEYGQMTLGGIIVVQTANALGIEVE